MVLPCLPLPSGITHKLGNRQEKKGIQTWPSALWEVIVASLSVKGLGIPSLAQLQEGTVRNEVEMTPSKHCTK